MLLLLEPPLLLLLLLLLPPPALHSEDQRTFLTRRKRATWLALQITWPSIQIASSGETSKNGIFTDFVFHFVFEVCFWLFVPVGNCSLPRTPLCIALPKKVTRQRASSWLQAKLTWMHRTGAHLYFEFATDYVLCFVFKKLLLIFCSSRQFTALHVAAKKGHLAVCGQLIANKADVNAKTRCAFIFWIWYWLFFVFKFASNFAVLEANAPLCIVLPKVATRQCASSWLQTKLTWMHRTSAHLYYEIATDFVLYFVF